MTTAAGVRERPILFSGPMVRAILDGRKSVTRRVLRPQPNKSIAHPVVGQYFQKPCPYGAPGDRLWVRETWQADFGYTFSDHERALWHEMPRSLRTLKAVQQGMGMLYYAADRSVYHAPTPETDEFGPEARLSTWEPTEDFWAELRWRPAIHMPRWASRITLEITEVRVERLQEITQADAEAEGALDPADPMTPMYDRRDVFRARWDSLNADRGYGWAANPWVWVVRFRRSDA